MRRLVAVALVAVGLMVVAASAAERRPPTGTEAVVFQLYRDFGFRAAIDETDFELPLLIDQSRDVLARYFDDELTTLLLKNRECDIKSHGICTLDGDFMLDTNGNPHKHVAILASPDPAVVRVSLYGEQEGTTVLHYTLRKTAAGWRIHDVARVSGPGDRHWSLLAILRGGKS